MPKIFLALFTVALTLASSTLHAQSTGIIIQSNGSQSAPGTSADSNSDAWPDDPFATLNDGDLWLASTASRRVAALRWSGGDSNVQTITLSTPSQDIQIQAPGTIAEQGEIAVFLDGAAPDLISLFGTGQAANFDAHCRRLHPAALRRSRNHRLAHRRSPPDRPPGRCGRAVAHTCR